MAKMVLLVLLAIINDFGGMAEACSGNGNFCRWRCDAGGCGCKRSTAQWCGQLADKLKS